jgi:hypothetical protein
MSPVRVFAYLERLDAFVVTDEYSRIAERLGLAEWNPVVWIGRLFYEAKIEPLIEQTNNAAYKQAHELLLKTRELMRRLGRDEDFDEYVELLHLEYEHKRNFIKLLDDME